MDILWDFIYDHIIAPMLEFFRSERHINGRILYPEMILLSIVVPIGVFNYRHPDGMKLTIPILLLYILFGLSAGAFYLVFCQIPYIGPIFMLGLCGVLTKIAGGFAYPYISSFLIRIFSIEMIPLWGNIIYYILLYLIILRLHIGDGL